MSDKNESKYWLERQWQRIERDWEKYENPIQIAFVIAGIAFPLFLSFGISEGSKLNPLVGILTSLSLWTLVITSILLIRNFGKGTKQQLDKMDKNIKDLTSSINDLRAEIRSERAKQKNE